MPGALGGAGDEASGAYDYITKPFTFDELRLVLDRVTAHLKLTAENRLLREQLKSKHGFGSLVGHAPEMEKLTASSPRPPTAPIRC